MGYTFFFREWYSCYIPGPGCTHFSVCPVCLCQNPPSGQTPKGEVPAPCLFFPHSPCSFLMFFLALCSILLCHCSLLPNEVWSPCSLLNFLHFPCSLLIFAHSPCSLITPLGVSLHFKVHRLFTTLVHLSHIAMIGYSFWLSTIVGACACPAPLKTGYWILPKSWGYC